MWASRDFACWYSSRTKLEAPSPITKPSRPLVKGATSHARLGVRAHCVNERKRSEGEGTERRLRGPGNHDVSPAVPEVTHGLANGHVAAGATVGIGGVPTPRSPNSIAVLLWAEPPKPKT